MDLNTLATLKVTAHARKAMRERDITAADVVAVLRRPAVVEPHEGRERFVGNGIVAVIAWERDRPVLITVLLRERGQWTNADARRR